MNKDEKRILLSTLPGFIFVLILISVHIITLIFNFDAYKFGVNPRTIEGIKGIFLSPFIHADWKHLFANAFPILFLSTFLILHYAKIAKEAFIWLFLLTGIFTWCLGRDSYHIGASGIIYGLAFFLFVLGLFRKDRQSMAISLIIVFLYGGLFWGLFPIFKNISWEAHLSGAISGVILALYFRKEYTKINSKIINEQEIEYEYEYWMVDENGNPLNPPIENTETDNTQTTHINYNYIYIDKNTDKTS